MSPSRNSVLIRFDGRMVAHADVEEWVVRRCAEAFVGLTGRLVEIPTLYKGPDLESVASLCGLSTSAVVEFHSGCEYVAWFLGFMPGFAYLGDVPEAIRAPRLSTPRKSVPPGSVGVAGAQTGIYSVESPGGWNLIGLTEVVLFDRAKGKSLIEPGDRVRFVPL